MFTGKTPRKTIKREKSLHEPRPDSALSTSTMRTDASLFHTSRADTLLESDLRAFRKYADLPKEVSEDVRKFVTSGKTELLSFDLDCVRKIGVCALPNKVHLWSFKTRKATVIQHSVLEFASNDRKPPVFALLPSQDTVGILVCLDGRCFFYENIWARDIVEVTLPLATDEEVVKIKCCMYGIVAASSHGKLYLSRNATNWTRLNKPASLGNLVNTLIGSQSASLAKQILFGANRSQGHAGLVSKDMFILEATGQISYWHMFNNGTARLVVDFSVTSELDRLGLGGVQIKSIDVVKECKLCVLGELGGEGILIVLHAQKEKLSLSEVKRLADFQIQNEPARVLLPNGGPMCFVSNIRGLYATSIIANNSFSELIPLNMQLLFAQTDSSKLESLFDDALSQLWVLVWPLGLLRLEFQTERIVNDFQQKESVSQLLNRKRINEIRSKIEQAILYGNQTQNPIVFSFSARDFDSAELSEAVLELVIDLAEQPLSSDDLVMGLGERILYFDTLRLFLTENSCFPLLNETVKHRFLWEREKAEACKKLYALYNENAQSKSFKNIFETAVEMLLSRFGDDSQGYAAIRSFFSRFMSKVDKLVAELCQLTGSNNERLVDVNEIVLTIYYTALEFRMAYRSQFHVQFPSIVTSWLGSFDVVEGIAALFESSLAINNDQIRYQVGRLGEVLMLSLSEFQQGTRESEDNLAAESHKLQLIPLQLAEFDPELAFEVARRHEQLGAIIELVHSYETNIQESLGQFYQEYRQKFAFELFEYYIKSERPAALYELPNDYYVDLVGYLEQEQLYQYLYMLYMRDKKYLDSSKYIELQIAREKDEIKKKRLMDLNKIIALAAYDAHELEEQHLSEKITLPTSSDAVMREAA